jgi:hypothetical protein
MLCSAAGTKSPAAVRNWARIGGKDKKNLRTEEIKKKPVHGGDKKTCARRESFPSPLIFPPPAELCTVRTGSTTAEEFFTFPAPEYGLPLVFSFLTPQQRLPSICSVNLTVLVGVD